MFVHPDRNLIPEFLIPSGRFVLKLFHPENILKLNERGAAISFFRSLSQSEKFMKPRNDVVWITDNKEDLISKANQEGWDFEDCFQVCDLKYSRVPSLFFSKTSPLDGVSPDKPRCVGKRRVALLNLQDRKDLRWKKMGIPPAAQIIMGSLLSSGIQVKWHPIFIDSINLTFIENYDLIGISVYEDFILETIEVINEIKEYSDIPVLLGGPMITLSSEYVAAHCGRADYFLRGEVEETFPMLLKALPANHETFRMEFMEKLASIEGFYGHGHDWWVSGNFDKKVELHDFSKVTLAVDQYGELDVKGGLEYSTSRGCTRSCAFCSQVHGKKMRKYSDKLVAQHLELVHHSLFSKANAPYQTIGHLTLNFNDDDMLLDPDRAVRLIKMAYEKDFKIWGVQTSIDSLKSDKRRERLFNELAGKQYFEGGRPLFWIGTDAFSSKRLQRLGKQGSPEDIRKVCNDVHQYGFMAYHYWIISDAESDWPEFIEEVSFLRELDQVYSNSFFVLPNAPSLIPYPSTQIYKKRIESEDYDRIILRKILHLEKFPELDYPVVFHERPKDNYLYALIEPRAQTPERLLNNSGRFLSYIKASQFDDALAEASRVLNLEIRDIQDLKRRQELIDVHKRILSCWLVH